MTNPNNKPDPVVLEDVPNLTNHSPTSLGTATPTTPSWTRWWRQVAFIPMLHNRWLTPTGRQQLTDAVRQAEVGHRGEVVMVVENTLPLGMARHHDSRDRAIELFGLYRVWDTDENTGVLVYLNVCEHRLEIVADRGINSQVMPSMWQALCDKAIEGIKAGKQIESLCSLLDDVGQLLRQHYRLSHDPRGNELSNNVVYLR